MFSIAERLVSNCPQLVPEGERRSGFSNRKEGCGFFFFVFLFDVHVCVYVVSVHTLATVHAEGQQTTYGDRFSSSHHMSPGTKLT